MCAYFDGNMPIGSGAREFILLHMMCGKSLIFHFFSTCSINAGQKLTTAHLHIVGVTPMAERFYVDSKDGRGSLKLAVFINLVGGVYIKELSGTKYLGYKARESYMTKQGKPAKGLTQQEYKTCMKSAEDYYMEHSPAFKNLKGDKFLVHDRCGVHPKRQIPEVTWKVVAHPPHSPDLMPLDYGIFGMAKVALDKKVRRAQSWDEKVQIFKTILKEVEVKATIEAFRSRLLACIDSKGAHFRIPRNTKRQ